MLLLHRTLILLTSVIIAGNQNLVTSKDGGAALEDVMCYVCVYSYHPTADDSCLRQPDLNPNFLLRCHHSRVCTIFRQWHKAEGHVRSFSRGCELRQGRRGSCVEDVHFVTCQSYCRGDRCNFQQEKTRSTDDTDLPIGEQSSSTTTTIITSSASVNGSSTHFNRRHPGSYRRHKAASAAVCRSLSRISASVLVIPVMWSVWNSF